MTETVSGFLKKLPADRRAALTAVRKAINAKLPDGYKECIQYGMIAWVVPESALPAREVYNKQPLALACLASQKSYMAVHLPTLYGSETERAWFEKAYAKTGKKLDMGKGCVRFKTLDALAVDVVAQTIARVPVAKYVKAYRAVHANRR
jgi:uncharacterized protein YdhG (YjbR/CyaY superfamily)